MSSEHFDTVIVGAGQAGLGVSYELKAAGVDHLVLEQGNIGESWRALRWDSFRLNTPAWMNRLPGGVEPREPDAFAGAADFVCDLERHVFRHRLPVRCGTTVSALHSDELRGGFGLETSDGLIRARSVVVAGGAARVPRVPALRERLPGAVEQLHTLRYRSPDALANGAVLVVGGGQSGVQVAEDLLDAGRSVLLATSRVGRMPRRYRGRDVLDWLSEAGFFDEARPPAVGRTPRQPQISGAGGGHTVSYQHLERRGAVLLGRLAAVEAGRASFGDDLADNAAHADRASAAIKQRIDAYIVASGVVADAAGHDPADEPYAPGRLPSGPSRLDLRAEGISTVIWATGSSADTRWLPGCVVDERGEIAHRQGSTALPGLFVVGQPWLRARRSAMIAGVAADAPHIAALVADRGLVPRRAVA